MQDALLTEYYHSVLDGAIFDGRLRIYYCQDDESPALRLYFEAQKINQQIGSQKYDLASGLVFVYLYPQDFKGVNIPSFFGKNWRVEKRGSNIYVLVQLKEGFRWSGVVEQIKKFFRDTNYVEA